MQSHEFSAVVDHWTVILSIKYAAHSPSVWCPSVDVGWHLSTHCQCYVSSKLRLGSSRKGDWLPGFLFEWRTVFPRSFSSRGLDILNLAEPFTNSTYHNGRTEIINASISTPHSNKHHCQISQTGRPIRPKLSSKRRDECHGCPGQTEVV
ncbi:hypothetical protein EYB25_003698 [Talaromyces marneffei]|uniref:uncharacterized protein n=1 Tax=Talaromyces marneffei TaxID=37727 RepID=UPI0012A89C64|nr:uncharacterized protein EYB26_006170 [Talaromyces marneffei]KAE8555150.1 hypothetical protein EYB25_003698 [Talaromyces marneffei]QGA18485.1 hypothetical protein EYB26_006170 [Talaromyces marneffei]